MVNVHNGCCFSFYSRLWDVATKAEVNRIELPNAPGLIELSADGSILSVPCGKMAMFYDALK